MTKKTLSLTEAVYQVLAEEADFRKSAIPTGIIEFDKRFFGFRTGELITIASKFKQSHELLLPYLVNKLALVQKNQMSVFLLDSSTRYLVDRVLRTSCDLSLDKIGMAPDSLEKVDQALDMSAVHIHETPRLNLDQLESEVAKEKPRFIVVSGTDRFVRNSDAYDEKSLVELSKSLKDLAVKHNCTVVIDAMLPLYKSNGDPLDSTDVADLPYNGALATYADLVFDIEPPTDLEAREYDLNIIGSRHGFFISTQVTI